MRQKIYGATATPYDYRVTASEPMVAAFEQLEQNVGAHNRYHPR